MKKRILLLLTALALLLSGCARISQVIDGGEDKTTAFFDACGESEFRAQFYNNLPLTVELTLEGDEATRAQSIDPVKIEAVFEALKSVRVGEAAEETAAAPVRSVTFIMADESRFAFRFEGAYLKLDEALRTLENDESFNKIWDELMQNATPVPSDAA